MENKEKNKKELNDKLKQNSKKVSHKAKSGKKRKIKTVEELSKEIVDVEKQISILLNEKKAVESKAKETEVVLRREVEKTEREIGRAMFEAQKSLVLKIIPIVDNLDRAVKSSKVSRNYDALIEGVKIVDMQIQALLDEYNITIDETKPENEENSEETEQ